jgi:hypothetical protein
MKIICPKCENVIAVAPETGLAETDLVCGNSGAQLRGPGPLEEAVDKVKEVMKETKKNPG